MHPPKCLCVTYICHQSFITEKQKPTQHIGHIYPWIIYTLTPNTICKILPCKNETLNLPCSYHFDIHLLNYGSPYSLLYYKPRKATESPQYLVDIYLGLGTEVSAWWLVHVTSHRDPEPSTFPGPDQAPSGPCSRPLSRHLPGPYPGPYPGTFRTLFQALIQAPSGPCSRPWSSHLPDRVPGTFWTVSGPNSGVVTQTVMDRPTDHSVMDK